MRLAEEKSMRGGYEDVPINLLLVDDDSALLSVHSQYFCMNGVNVKTASNGDEAMTLLEKENYDVILTDLIMPEMSGLELLKRLKESGSNAEVIIVTGFGTVDSAKEAIRSGAFDYLPKPTKVGRLLIDVQRAAETCRLKYENFLLKHSDVKKSPAFYEFSSPSMKNMLQQLKLVSATEAESAILLLGESGVGKEIAANYIHNSSKRSDNAFIKVHCASLSPTLLESELFGHEKGSFTGATGERKGRFEMANGGTIFLDEINTVPMESQIKLLRVLQEKKLERVGGSKTISVDFRLVTASNEDLGKLVEKGLFRKDLYYRISVIPVKIPPLRELKSDIPKLIDFFMNKICGNIGKPLLSLSPSALDSLTHYNWPGNVRELQNVIERAVVLDVDGIVDCNDLPSEISCGDAESVTGLGGNGKNLKSSMAVMEKEYIKKLFASEDYNVTKTAKLLGISRRSLQQKISKYGLRPDI